jgi:hypothetical protein
MATSLKEIPGGKAEGRIPPNGHPGQSAGLVVDGFLPMRGRFVPSNPCGKNQASQAWVVATELISGY